MKTKINKKILLVTLLSLFLIAIAAGPVLAQSAQGGVGAKDVLSIAAGPIGAALLPAAGDIALRAVTAIIETYVRVIGQVTVGIIGSTIALFQYNKFVNADIVTVGWNLVRDITNMVFVIMFLVMAFYTVLGRDEYGARKFLVRLVIAAVAVNFSRTIAGLIIDFSQVVMLTFVNGFLAVAGGNFVQAFGITGYLTPESGTDAASLLGTYIFGAILVTVTFFVIISMLVMLLARIIMLWLLIILSPLAFVASVLPGKIGSKASGWWEYFINYNMAGPILAFFVWLTLYYMNYLQAGNWSTEGFIFTDAGDKSSFSSASKVSLFFGSAMSTIMLLIGVKMAAGTKVFGANFADKAVGYMKQGAAKAGKAIGRAGMRGAGQATAGARLKMGDFLTKVPLLRGAGAAMIRSSQKGTAERQDKWTKQLDGLTFAQKQRFEQTALTSEGKTAARKAQMDDFFGIRKHLTGEDLPKDMPADEKKRIQLERLQEWKGKLKEESSSAKKRNDGALLGKIAGLKRDNPGLYDLSDADDVKGFAATIARANYADLEKIDPTQLDEKLIEAMGDAGRKNIMNRGNEGLKERVRQFEGGVAARPPDIAARDLASGDLEAKELRPQDLAAEPRGQLARRLLDDDMEDARKGVMKVPELRQAFMVGLENAQKAVIDPDEKRRIAENQVIFGGSAQLENKYSYDITTHDFTDAGKKADFGQAMRGERGGDVFAAVATDAIKAGAGSSLVGTIAESIDGRTLTNYAKSSRKEDRKAAQAADVVIEHIMAEAAKPGATPAMQEKARRITIATGMGGKGQGGKGGGQGGGQAATPVVASSAGETSGIREVDLDTSGPDIEVEAPPKPPRGGGRGGRGSSGGGSSSGGGGGAIPTPTPAPSAKPSTGFSMETESGEILTREPTATEKELAEKISRLDREYRDADSKIAINADAVERVRPSIKKAEADGDKGAAAGLRALQEEYRTEIEKHKKDKDRIAKERSMLVSERDNKK